MEIAKELCDFLESMCIITKLFSSPEDFWVSLKISKPGQVDFVIIDYRLYQLDVFNPYKEMQRQNNIVPIVFYNDPYPEPGSRAVYWKTKNKRYFAPYIQESFLDSLYPLWKRFETFLNSEEINPHLEVIRQAQPLHAFNDGVANFKLSSFIKMTKLTPSRAKLLEVFDAHRGEEMTVENICILVWGRSDKSALQTFYSYVHDLRSVFEKEKSVSLSLERKQKGVYAFYVREKENPFSKYKTAMDFFTHKPTLNIKFKTVSEEYIKSFPRNADGTSKNKSS